MEIRRGTRIDVESVVNIHCKAFPGFFLTSLGGGFLRELYRGFVDSGGLFLVAVDNERIIGFIVGTPLPKTFFSDVRKRRWFFFVVKALPAVIHSPVKVLRKLFGGLFYRGDTPVEIEGGALISSIGVLPELSGEGVGFKLMQSFEQHAKKRGAKLIYLTTDRHKNEAVNSFYHKCGYEVESSFIQSGGREMYRYQKKC